MDPVGIRNRTHFIHVRQKLKVFHIKGSILTRSPDAPQFLADYSGITQYWIRYEL